MGGPKVRLWDRWWLGLSAVAVAAAASGPTGPALAAGEPSVRASAEAVTVVAPGAAAEGTGLVMASGPPAAGGSYRDEGGGGTVRAGWAKATAVKHQGASPTAEAETVLRHVRLLHGTVRVRKISATASLAAQPAGGVRDETGGEVRGLVVLGREVHPGAGARLELGDWGTLDVLASTRAATNGSVAETITGLRLVLLRDHAGLPAGTVVELGTAKAAITTAPAGGGQGSSGGGGSGAGGTSSNGGTTPPPPPAKKHPPKRHHDGPSHKAAARRHHPAHRVAPLPDARIAQASHALIEAAAGGRARVIAAALDQVGWPYIWGGESRSEGGFDCSGLVDYAYAHAGMALPGRPTAAVLWRMSVPVTRARLQPGDLAFLYSRRRAPYHVALYVGDGLVVVAPHTGADVQIEPLAAVPWDGYGRLLAGGRGDGLARNVAAAARRFAHPGRSRLQAARAADALAARRVRPPGEVFIRRLRAARVPVATVAAEPTPRLVALASVRTPDSDGGSQVAGVAMLVLLAAACIVRVPTRRHRSGED